ncbi:MAG: hypothetical protein LBR61_10610 [Synergistaceae bacterium]|jgi:hypothetical protein|nr:hypothetical protein [Synergistaceae bacterium]
MSDYSKLARNSEMWTYLGFTPWEQGSMQGVSRQITMVKGSLMLPIAKYYAWDYIVWLHRDGPDIEWLLREWKPLPDVVTQRFLLVGGSGSDKRRVKSFAFGFRGFLEIYSYTPGGPYHPKVKDLIPPVDLAWKDPA